jgi:hypothetical protein
MASNQYSYSPFLGFVQLMPDDDSLDGSELDDSENEEDTDDTDGDDQDDGRGADDDTRLLDCPVELVGWEDVWDCEEHVATHIKHAP